MTGSADRPEPDGQQIPTVERIIETLVFGPFDLIASIGGRAPRSLPDAIANTRHELATARFLGKFAVDLGVKRLKQELERNADRSSAAADVDPPTASSSAPDVAAAPPVSDGDDASDAGDAGDGVVPEVDGLALPDYDTLPATQIIVKLAGLDAAERDAIEAYEQANRRRRTVLGKLDQLRAS